MQSPRVPVDKNYHGNVSCAGFAAMEVRTPIDTLDEEKPSPHQGLDCFLRITHPSSAVLRVTNHLRQDPGALGDDSLCVHLVWIDFVRVVPTPSIAGHLIDKA